MRQLTIDEVNQVNGGVSQEAAIGGNLSIVAIGAGVAIAGSAPVWFPVLMIGVSVSLTASYAASLWRNRHRAVSSR
ncbi:hypothetical protein [Psychrobium sp. 1_MG-2023]|uniref:hypothetical protein n=1 Tax=Psychrobium sp. 1_MG-2023 TaxID=3062624 RepID=UPI000C34F4A6|nr:hypothetical protein [Psychrobium sp. 1_MG-2023]MDP2562510.1 hypothetical protein [Psychrobium sp. 1_MG-2023]PKF57999.1 hypothetical protein CW748_05630 [Alteromonadales bacterium alter-6D02]